MLHCHSEDRSDEESLLKLRREASSQHDRWWEGEHKVCPYMLQADHNPPSLLARAVIHAERKEMNFWISWLNLASPFKGFSP